MEIKKTVTEKIQDFIINWNSNFPLDRWWREKYNIPFNSEKHRQMSLIDMRIQFEEDKIFVYAKEARKRGKSLSSFLEELKKQMLEADFSEFEKMDLKDIDLSKFDK